MGKFVRGTIDTNYYNRLMTHKKFLKESLNFDEKELTLPALQRYDDSLIAVRYKRIVPNYNNILNILRGNS